jgi:hypothetical protein
VFRETIEVETTATFTTMAAKPSQNARKKKTVSKHVLKAREGKEEALISAEQATALLTQPSVAPSSEKKKKGKNRHVKDPSEGATYLTGWQERKTTTSDKTGAAWKFNKNTQSWLIRHMYEVGKVSKGSFSILLEYLDGLEGKTTRSRMRAEANRRALRYKKEEQAKKNSDEATSEKDDDKEKSAPADKSENVTDPTISDQEQMEEQTRWEKLNENEQRKEYKRARKILETIKE